MQNRPPDFLQAFHFLFRFKEHTFPSNEFSVTVHTYPLLFYQTEY